jgi:hypothetical protein
MKNCKSRLIAFRFKLLICKPGELDSVSVNCTTWVLYNVDLLTGWEAAIMVAVSFSTESVNFYRTLSARMKIMNSNKNDDQLFELLPCSIETQVLISYNLHTVYSISPSSFTISTCFQLKVESLLVLSLALGFVIFCKRCKKTLYKECFLLRQFLFQHF